MLRETKGWMAGALGALVMTATAQAQNPPTPAPWADAFDAPHLYAAGQDPTLPSVGGWEPFLLVHNLGATISANRFISAPHSLRSGGDADLVQKFSGTSGAAWVVDASLYVPGPGQPDELGLETWFILLNTYGTQPASPKSWSLQLGFDPATNLLRYFGGPNSGMTFPFPKDAWIRVLVHVDFTQPAGSANAQALYDIGAGLTPLGPPFDWTEGASPGGADRIQALDLFGGFQSGGPKPNGAVYFDDLRLDSTAAAPVCAPKSGLACGEPAISASGTASATSASGFVVSAAPARSDRAGILLYNTSVLPTRIPFQGGALCLEPMGLRRAGPTNSQGSCGPADCTGSFAVDMNAFAQGQWTVPDCAGNPSGLTQQNPAAFLGVPGTHVYAQFWGRDTVATGSFLSGMLAWWIGP